MRQLPLVLTLLLSTAPSFAQSLACHPIRRGESAAQAARRVTGDSGNMYLASFQIMNGSSRFIPKSQYNRLVAGWRACVVALPARATASNDRRIDTPEVVAVADEPPASHASDAPLAPPSLIDAAVSDPPVRLRVSAISAASVVNPRRIGEADLTMVWLGAAIAVPWFGLQIVDGYLTRRRVASALMQHFASRFITEFERPLVRDDGTEPVVQTRVRRSRRGRFDILLAPGRGRRYPNLEDHRRNVEYDVDRVLKALDDHFFLNGAPYAQAGWVVVPFQPRTDPKKPGITCISSF